MSHPTKPIPVTATARDVICNPDLFAARPDILTDAWAVLMDSRGKRVAMHRTGPARHLTGQTDADPDTDPNAALCRRIHQHAARIGVTGPAPLILRGANQ